MTILYLIVAILGLGFLVLIHELGHFLMAKKVGMKVEVFSIGFGKPIFSFERNKIKYQIGCVPFGGYVKIAGMTKEGDLEPHQIKDGFFGKKPWDRIKVAFMGPFTNLVFAFLIFVIIWLSGGREKPFYEYSNKVGYIEKKSELYTNGIRSGDEITKYDGRAFLGFKDLLYSGIKNDPEINVQGNKINYFTDSQEYFNYNAKTYNSPLLPREGLKTTGILSTASYVIYQESSAKTLGISAIDNSGIKIGDRILWVSGNLIFSNQQQKNVVNKDIAFLTVLRKKNIFHVKIPKIQLEDLKLPFYDKEEINDWRHDAKIKTSFSDLYYLPYYFNENCVIEDEFNFVEDSQKEKVFNFDTRNPYDKKLFRGDKILAINGTQIRNSVDLLKNLQDRKLLIVVQRNKSVETPIPYETANKDFEKSFQINDLNNLVASIGVANEKNVNDLHFLNPITPIKLVDTPLFKKQIEGRQDKDKIIEMNQKSFMLGFSPKDRNILYNPNPFILFSSVWNEILLNMKLLFKTMKFNKVAGPVSIIAGIQQQLSVSVKEALFWLAFISFNLGIVNLLPLPIIDGGHIVISFIEMITKKRLDSKTMERIFIPFYVLLIGFAIYITYNDISRLFYHFFK